jgi:hypothetical protein
MRQREARGQRVREEGRIEIEADAETFGPIDPAAEMLRPDCVAIDLAAAEVAVRRVQVESMLPRDQRERFRCVGAKLVGRPRLAGIITRRCETATDLLPRRLEPPDVVSLPTVDRDWNSGQRLQRLIRVNPEICVLLFREVIGRLDMLVGHHSYLLTTTETRETGESGVILGVGQPRK